MSGLTVEQGQAQPVRLDVLSYPSPTTSRYLLFVTALLTSGLFVGNYVHGMIWGDSWLQTVAVCQTSTSAGTTDRVAQSQRFFECTANVERIRAGVMWLGALLVLVAAVGLMWFSPSLVVRRRRLRPFPKSLDDARARFDQLARDAGVQGRVGPLLGATGQRDGFSFGRPGHYRVVLPPAVAVRWRDPSLFDPLVNHELAHVRHRDVALAWLTRAVWWVLLPLLAVPVVVAFINGDYSILGDYLWRVALLAGVVTLLSRGLLRSREHGADLRAAQQFEGTTAMLALLDRLQSPRFSRAGRLLAFHPVLDDRRAVLERPVLFARTGLVDGLVSGLLAMLAMPLVVSSLTPALAPSGGTQVGNLVGAAVLGPLLAGSVGLALWRSALMVQVGGPRVPVGQVAAGVALGLVVGQAVSLGQIGLGGLAGTSSPAWLVVTGAAGAGSVVLSLSLGYLWADMAPRLRRARTAWVVALLVNGLLFATLLWVCTLFQSAVEQGGWALARQALLAAPLSAWTVVAVALVLGAFSGLTLARPTGGAAPGWLVGHSKWPWPQGQRMLRPTIVMSFGAGLTGAAAIVAYRWIAGPGANDAANWQLLQSYQWVAGLTGAALLLMMAWTDRTRGVGAAVTGGPVAVLTVSTGYVVLNTVLGGNPDPAFIAQFTRPALTLGLYLGLLMAPLTLLFPRRTLSEAHGGKRPALVRTTSVVLTVALPLAGAASALTGRDMLVGPVTTAPLVPDDAASTDIALFALATELRGYELEVAPHIEQTYNAARARAKQLLGDPSLSVKTRQALFEDEVLGPLRSLATQVATTHLEEPRMVTLHGEAQHGLELAMQRYTLLAESGADLDQSKIDTINALQQEEAVHWQAWDAQRRDVLDDVRPLLEELSGH